MGRSSYVVALVVYAGLFGYPFLQSLAVEASPRSMAIEWPRQYEGQALRPLALSAVEQRFADRFPGSIGRFGDGRGTLVLRHVSAPTRMLHPAGDCYRELGYRVSADALERQVIARVGSGASLQRCFVAERNGHRLRVCEHIIDSTGQVYTDTQGQQGQPGQKPQPGLGQAAGQEGQPGQSQPNRGQTPAGQATLRPGGSNDADLSRQIMEDRRNWGNVTPRGRAASQEGAQENVVDKYRKIIEEYYRAMATKASERR